MTWSEWAQAAASSPSKRLVDNQIDLFTQKAIDTQLYLAITSSGCSIVACLAALYMYFAIDPKRLVFRHQLIALLLFYDLLKALVLMIFPARVAAQESNYGSNIFCQVIGFFTATSIEGADFAILAFAVHTFLLIFKPELNVKFPGSSRVEGGLYNYRYYFYGLAFVIPMALASFPYILKGYSSFVCWCYLPQDPIWMRIVLSWVPRYCIVIVIFGVYGSIYYHVLKEFRALGGVFVTMQRQTRPGLYPSSSSRELSFFNSIVYFFRDVRDYVLPKCILPDGENRSSISSSSSSNRDFSKTESPRHMPTDDENVLDNAQFQAANLENFRYRQKTIEKQMKSIFVYPVAYISIWLFPFILHCTQFSYESAHGPIVWLNCVSAFAQPFIGFVDSVVFFYREEPWKYTIMRTFERENSSKVEQNLLLNLAYADSESINTSARVTRSSIGGLRVDLGMYSRWRRILSKLNFPFMHLPDEANIGKFQEGVINKKLRDLKDFDANIAQRGDMARSDSIEINALQAKHDFSNLLDGSFNCNEFRQTLDNYSFSFQNERKASMASSSEGKRRSSLASVSNKSSKSRRPSVYEYHDPIPEDGTYMHNNHKHLQPGVFVKQTSNSNSGSIDQNIAEEEGELDFLEILNRGPG